MARDVTLASKTAYPAIYHGSGPRGELLLRRVFAEDAPATAGTPGVLYYRARPGDRWTKVTQTLERPSVTVGGIKPHIPAGTYSIDMVFSPKQAQNNARKGLTNADPRRPTLVGVPGYSGIQIHTGVTVEKEAGRESSTPHSTGCILVGRFGRFGYRRLEGDSTVMFEKVRDLWRTRPVEEAPATITIEEVRVDSLA